MDEVPGLCANSRLAALKPLLVFLNLANHNQVQTNSRQSKRRDLTDACIGQLQEAQSTTTVQTMKATINVKVSSFLTRNVTLLNLR